MDGEHKTRGVTEGGQWRAMPPQTKLYAPPNEIHTHPKKIFPLIERKKIFCVKEVGFTCQSQILFLLLFCSDFIVPADFRIIGRLFVNFTWIFYFSKKIILETGVDPKYGRRNEIVSIFAFFASWIIMYEKYNKNPLMTKLFDISNYLLLAPFVIISTGIWCHSRILFFLTKLKLRLMQMSTMLCTVNSHFFKILGFGFGLFGNILILIYLYAA